MTRTHREVRTMNLRRASVEAYNTAVHVTIKKGPDHKSSPQFLRSSHMPYAAKEGRPQENTNHTGNPRRAGWSALAEFADIF